MEFDYGQIKLFFILLWLEMKVREFNSSLNSNNQIKKMGTKRRIMVEKQHLLLEG